MNAGFLAAGLLLPLGDTADCTTGGAGWWCCSSLWGAPHGVVAPCHPARQLHTWARPTAASRFKG
ncbi:hypothetical protein [Nitrosococcus halophilus]|uniref:hypothetical protein n=1 Tax=Nitrosococcus halophilus TaxID=133539 RepID=UPI0012FF2376|nr:hypothetical protein [Nitrosococcus halophilus]